MLDSDCDQVKAPSPKRDPAPAKANEADCGVSGLGIRKLPEFTLYSYSSRIACYCMLNDDKTKLEFCVSGLFNACHVP